MAGLTKEQRAQRAAEKLAAELAAKNNSQEQEQEQEQDGAQLVAMFTDFPAFPGAPTTADVHPDEVDNWKAAGWRIEE